MKALIALFIVQAAFLIFLGVRVTHLEARTSELTAAVYEQSVARAGSAQSAKLDAFSARNTAAALSGPSADEIRAIIREVLSSSSTPLGSGAAENKPDTRSNSETLALRNAVLSDVNYYIGQGRIGEGEMAQLQLKIAQLPPEQRREMLNRLTRAMNTGELDGRF